LVKPLAATDPDVAYFRSQQTAMNAEQKQMLQDLALVCEFKATSDLPQWLGSDERNELHTFLEARPSIERTGRYSFRLDDREVDFSPAIPLPEPPKGFEALASLLVGWLGNQGWALKLMDRMGKNALQKMINNL
jgi:hypothetical protein